MRVWFDERKLADLGYHWGGMGRYMFKVANEGESRSGAVFVDRYGKVETDGDEEIVAELIEELGNGLLAQG